MADAINFTSSNVTVVTTAETAILTTPAMVYDQPSGAGVRISGVVEINPVGTGASVANVRVRQGSGTTGALVGVAEPQNCVAGNSLEVTFDVEDTTRYSAQSGGGQYTVTLAMTGATGNTTVSQALIDARGL